jgi:hypothetical protein
MRHRLSMRILAVGAVIGAMIGALAGCRTATTAPPSAHLSGNWSRDAAASDDVDAKVAAAIAKSQSLLRRRNNRMGYGSGDGNAPEVAEPPDESFDTPGDRYGGPGQLGPDYRGLRTRLLQSLRPPTQLIIEVNDDLVRISADRLPPRDYQLGERISRFDEYGTSIINARWSHAAFVLRSSYTSHASRTVRYEVDPVTGLLTVTDLIFDPTLGRLELRSVYRRG